MGTLQRPFRATFAEKKKRREEMGGGTYGHERMGGGEKGGRRACNKLLFWAHVAATPHCMQNGSGEKKVIS